MEKNFKDYLEFIKQAKQLGAIEVQISDTGASVKFAGEINQSAAVVNDLFKQNQQDDDEDTLYWSSGS